ncbi:MAG: beta-lactamase family protein [Clostridia bacterium]|nr:beta-lactamase family protein [Clostridia bacterium]
MDFSQLHDYMNRLIEKGVPGLELAVCRRHEVLFHECAGYSDYNRTQTARPSDRYWMYSCTKPVLAASAMRCIEDGLFGLDDPVSKYLPAYENAFVLKNGEKQPLSEPMLIRHLFTMTAGLDYNKQRGGVARVVAETNGRATTIQLAEAMAEEALSFEPGERFQYSLCHDVLGAVIEKASGMSLRDYMKAKIFEPLEMTQTDFWTAEEKPRNLAAQYVYDSNRKILDQFDQKNDFVLSENYYSGGAGLLSTCEDYLKFTDAMSCGGVGAHGARILKAETIDLMRSEQIPAFRVEGSFTCTCGPDYGYGLGVRTRIAFNEGVPSALGEFGWDGAAGADMLMDPEHELSMMFMTHIRNWPAMLGPVHLQIRDILYPLLGL